MAIWIAIGLVTRIDKSREFTHAYYLSVESGGYREAQEHLNDCIGESRLFGLTNFKLIELREMSDDEIIKVMRSSDMV
jgi:hypothetical protein